MVEAKKEIICLVTADTKCEKIQLLLVYIVLLLNCGEASCFREI